MSEPSQEDLRADALQKCAQALTALDEWLGQASTRQYADDACWRARRALQAAGVEVPMNSNDQHWRGSVFRALEQCGLGWTGYEGEIRFRLSGQPNWSTAAGPPLKQFLDAAFKLLGVARGMLIESPGNCYWLEEDVASMLGAKKGAEDTVPIRCSHCGRNTEMRNLQDLEQKYHSLGLSYAALDAKYQTACDIIGDERKELAELRARVQELDAAAK